MASANIELHRPKQRRAFLWKYIDLQRFIYLLTENKLFFSRLDRFEDPFEGVATTLLKKGRHYARVPGDRKLKRATVASGKRQQLQNIRKFFDFIQKYEAADSQKTQYVNSWFCDERESMAMWNLFSNPDSVAMKVKFDDLSEALKESFGHYNAKRRNALMLIGDNVKYLRLNPFDKKLSPKPLRYSAFKKDKSFEYEKEYRFILLNKNKKTRAAAFHSLPVDLEKMKLKIITHPNMEDWKYKNLERIVEYTGDKVILERSPILLRDK